MRLIIDGEVDRSGIGGLARSLGLTSRQVLRIVESSAGCGPLKLARAARVHMARLLLKETTAPMEQVARATGFTSARQFNATVQTFYHATPSVLRFGARRRADPAVADTGPLVLWCALPHRPPFDANTFLAGTGPAITDMTEQGEHWYARTVRLPHGAGHLRIGSDSRGRVLARLSVLDPRDIMPLYARTRLFLDLDTEPSVVDPVLIKDPALAPQVNRCAGTRAPGTIDREEALFTAVISERFDSPHSVLQDLVARLGEASPWGLLFPSAAAIAEHGRDILLYYEPAPSSPEDHPGAGTYTVLALARQIEAGELHLHYGTSRAYLTNRLAAVPGIDHPAAVRLTCRTLGDADELAQADPAVVRGARALGLPTDPAQLTRRGLQWAPWRSYAAAHLRAAGRPEFWASEPGGQ